MSDVRILCLSVDPQRRRRMEARFAQVAVRAEFPPMKGPDDPRLAGFAPEHRRVASIMANHVAALGAIAESGLPWGIVCEDDVHLRRTFATDLEQLLPAFRWLELDVLLLGYLIDFDPRGGSEGFPVVPGAFSLHAYPDDLWGSQMYLVRAGHAAWLCEKYALERRSSIEGLYVSDFTITKEGRRALVYPMLAVEEGEGRDAIHEAYHQRCARANYDPARYV